jgi:hypothetical protein
MPLARNALSGAFAAALTITLIPAAIPTASASTAGWRVVQSTANRHVTAISAVSAKNAWAVGYTSSGDATQPLVQQWNGSSWTAVAFPKTSPRIIPETVSATSSTNVWVGASALPDKSYVLHWNGKAWKVAWKRTVPADFPVVPSVLALSSKNVWSVVASDERHTQVRHFNGHTWATVKTPAKLDVMSAVSSRNIWAAGELNGKPCILRWNGKVWKVQAKPSTPSGRSFSGLSARNSKDVWVVGGAFSPPTKKNTAVALHWDGVRWRDHSPKGIATDLISVAPDGHGGIWASGTDGRLHHFAFSKHGLFGEQSTSGTWTSVAAPAPKGSIAQVNALIPIPHRASLWGVETLDNDYGPQRGPILRLGS